MVIGPDGCGFDMRSPSEMEADDARREADEAAHAPRMAVTSRIRRVAQPPDGYLPLSLFDEVRLADPVPLYAFEDVPADVTGLAVDYLSRVARGVPARDAFRVPLAGARLVGRSADAERLLAMVDGFSDRSVRAACLLCGFDAAQRRDLPSQSIKLEVASVPAHEPQTRPARVNYPSVSAIAGDIILAVESPTEILADKLLSFACSSHIRRRDLWDMCWLSSRADVDASRAFRMATLKAGEYGEVGEWEARAGRLREIPSVLSSDAFLDEMRRFLPARMLVATVESLSWREYASQAVTGLYDPSGPAWASPYGSPGFGRPMPEPDQSSAVPMWRDGGPALS